VESNLFHIGKHVIKIRVGYYEMSDISELLPGQYANLTQNEPVGSNTFYLVPSYNTLKSEIFSTTDLIHFNKNQSIGSLLGFTSKILKPNTRYMSLDLDIK